MVVQRTENPLKMTETSILKNQAGYRQNIFSSIEKSSSINKKRWYKKDGNILNKITLV